MLRSDVVRLEMMGDRPVKLLGNALLNVKIARRREMQIDFESQCNFAEVERLGGVTGNDVGIPSWNPENMRKTVGVGMNTE